MLDSVVDSFFPLISEDNSRSLSPTKEDMKGIEHETYDYYEKHIKIVERAIDLMSKMSDEDFIKNMEGYASLIRSRKW